MNAQQRKHLMDRIARAERGQFAIDNPKPQDVIDAEKIVDAWKHIDNHKYNEKRRQANARATEVRAKVLFNPEEALAAVEAFEKLV